MNYVADSNAVVMPSRTIMLIDVPPELNNSERLRTYFSKYGALLWVNEKYGHDSEAAITFFSISDAIAAFLDDEPVLENGLIRKSWFEYGQQCELCSYKYLSEESLQKHMAKYHMAERSENDQLGAVGETSNVTSDVALVNEHFQQAPSQQNDPHETHKGLIFCFNLFSYFPI